MLSAVPGNERGLNHDPTPHSASRSRDLAVRVVQGDRRAQAARRERPRTIPEKRARPTIRRSSPKSATPPPDGCERFRLLIKHFASDGLAAAHVPQLKRLPRDLDTARGDIGAPPGLARGLGSTTTHADLCPAVRGGGTLAGNRIPRPSAHRREDGGTPPRRSSGRVGPWLLTLVPAARL